ncbi:hypothetical protein GBF38_009172 [Nibea albiflora]|uniref:Uncharacterized protein n=1 Tax=Nibea albiflora TaxID=240163 RepID=A0ACB7EQA7_NIBAL|nr:hypothetical protein GBF38_009172 [Nibea albiflora]
MKFDSTIHGAQRMNPGDPFTFNAAHQLEEVCVRLIVNIGNKQADNAPGLSSLCGHHFAEVKRLKRTLTEDVKKRKGVSEQGATGRIWD